MIDEKKDEKARDNYDGFFEDVDQFSSRSEETAFIDSLDSTPPPEETTVKVGERVKAVRERRNLTLEDVSRRTDIDVTHLSEIERGTISPPLGTIIRLAKALEMKMGYFISGEGNRACTIVRKGDSKVVSRYDAEKMKQYGYEYQSLAPHKKDRHMDPFMVTLDPSATEDERSHHNGQEYLFVLKGRMEVRLDEDIHVLEPGDSIYYDSEVPHLVKCHGNETTKVLAVFYTEK